MFIHLELFMTITKTWPSFHILVTIQHCNKVEVYVNGLSEVLFAFVSLPPDFPKISHLVFGKFTINKMWYRQALRLSPNILRSKKVSAYHRL